MFSLVLGGVFTLLDLFCLYGDNDGDDYDTVDDVNH